jgi:glucose-1-phosphate adenylyltransferase
MRNIVVLAGGIGSRMKNSLSAVDPGLLNLPKAMIPVDKENRPFLDYLLFNIKQAGYENVVIVTGENGTSIPFRYGENYMGLQLKYIEQPIPQGRAKPLGSSDALIRVLDANKDWAGGKFTICNSDNLYSVTALSLLRRSDKHNAFIDYDKLSLRLPEEKISKYAVTVKNAKNYLIDIIEKPSPGEIKSLQNRFGRLGISMNLWLFTYKQVYEYLMNTPMHPERDEKELAVTVKLIVKENKYQVYAYPLKEAVPDLSTAGDIETVRRFIKEHIQLNLAK